MGRKKKTPDIIKPKREDKFLTDEDKVSADDARVINPTDTDIMDEMSQLESFRDYQRELGSNSI